MSAHRKDDIANEMYSLYKSGFSLNEVARAYGITRQSVYAMFSIRFFTLRTAKPLPFIFFNGFKYSRRSNGYFAKTNKGRSYLHRDVWINFNGAIPEGFDVHHINGNKEDNNISNLELLSFFAHGIKHAKSNVGFKSTQFKKGMVGKYYPKRPR